MQTQSSDFIIAAVHLDFTLIEGTDQKITTHFNNSIGGLVVEYSPATRVTRVRFPVDAYILLIIKY